jgi:dipeptide/tripeptide permease
MAVWFGFWAGFLLAAIGMMCAWALIQFDNGRLAGIGDPPAASSGRQALLIFIGAIAAIPVAWFLLNNTMENAEASAKIAKAGGDSIEFIERTSDTTFKIKSPAEALTLPARFGLEGDEYKIVEVKALSAGMSEVTLDSTTPLKASPIASLNLLSNEDSESRGSFVFVEIQSPSSIMVRLPEKLKPTDEDKIPKTPAKFGLNGKVLQVDQINLLENRNAELVLNPSTPATDPPVSNIELISGPNIIKYLLALPLLGKVLFGFAILAVIGIPIWSYYAGTREEAEKMVVAIVLVVFSVVFWTLFEQAGSSMTLFAERNTDLHVVGNYEMPAAQTQIFNPIFIVIFAPLFSIMWVWLGKRKLEPSIPVKFAIGLVLVGLGFLVLVYGSRFPDANFQVALFWLAMAYLLHSLGELCISPVGLSMITKLSIARVVGLMMGVWFLSSSMAQYVGGIVAQFASVETIGGQVTNLEKSLSTYVSVFNSIGIASIIAGGILFVLSPLLKRMMHGVK